MRFLTSLLNDTPNFYQELISGWCYFTHCVKVLCVIMCIQVGFIPSALNDATQSILHMILSNKDGYAGNCYKYLNMSLILFSRKRWCIWRHFLEGNHPCSCLCQCPGTDVLWPAHHQARSLAQSPRLLYSFCKFILKESHSHVQSKEAGMLSGSTFPYWFPEG
jgi:hypothetical protein